ncbi:hypothetical protein GCM10027515_08810 [Schumannella luteola]|uniref:Putative membrane protein YdfJ with MMPL/SSD domain n=1 Tax=Schumannella luteola TaxID=472059 RepID=A0A852Y9V6_9MICO|nr:hypothetical protein [Schumannella luteola]NYG97991.1 putative membrane protein YdfJ with MMPL/SSD domain [Schumannella luteola]
MPHSRRRALILCGIYIVAAVVVGVAAGFLSAHPDEAASQHSPRPSVSVAPVESR